MFSINGMSNLWLKTTVNWSWFQNFSSAGKNIHWTQTLAEKQITIATASVPDLIIWRCVRSLRLKSDNTYQQNQDVIEQFMNSNVNSRMAEFLEWFLLLTIVCILSEHKPFTKQIFLNVVCFLLGNSPASEIYMQLFWNTLSVPSS
jgi:hypothetical protein